MAFGADIPDATLQVAEHLEKAVNSALDQGYRTADLYSDGTKKVGCTEMGDVLLQSLQQRSSTLVN
jgi:hypothetical protein